MTSLKTKVLVLFYMCTLIGVCYSACSAGEYMSGTNVCQTCPGGSYMDIHNHTSRQCITCTAHAYDHTIVEYPCNTTHDTGYVCEEGRFNSNGKLTYCAMCRDCQDEGKFEARPCTQTNDTICCPKANMTLVEAGNETCWMANATNMKFCCIEKDDPQNTSPLSSTLVLEMTLNVTTGKEKPTATIPTTTEVPQPRSTSFLVDERNIKRRGGQSGLDIGTINGIASLVVIIGITIFGVLYCKKQRKQKERQQRRGV